MLSVVKNIFSSDIWGNNTNQEESGSLELRKLRSGAGVGFGFMPQASLSGKRFQIQSLNSYLFMNDKFLSFKIAQDSGQAFYMIVAEDKGARYLAISRKMTIDEQAKLFGDEAIDNVIQNSKANHLVTKETLEEYKGWVAPSYTRRIGAVRGKLMKGDWRQKPVEDTNKAQDFDYFLLASANDEFAVEIEKYDDGHVEVYATIFRPITDVGQFTPSEKDTFKPKLATATIMEEEDEVEILRPSDLQDNVAAKPEPVMSNSTEVVMSKDTETLEREIAVAAPQPMPMEQPDMIACDMRVAGRIIDEAIKNEMTMSELIRKVIDLPLTPVETVHIPFALSPAEYEILGERYGIDAKNQNAIRKQILEDLSNFAGKNVAKKKKQP